VSDVDTEGVDGKEKGYGRVYGADGNGEEP
jgi:hypothetical protein